MRIHGRGLPEGLTVMAKPSTLTQTRSTRSVSLRPRGGPRDGTLATLVPLFLLASIIGHASSDLHLKAFSDARHQLLELLDFPGGRGRMWSEINSETLRPLPVVETRSSSTHPSQYGRSDSGTSQGFDRSACGTTRLIVRSTSQGYAPLFLRKDLAREIHLPPTSRWNVRPVR